MFFGNMSRISQYAPLLLPDNGESSSSPLGKHSSSEDDDHSAPLLEDSENDTALAPSNTSQLPKLILYFSFALAMLSTVNVALLPATLSNYRAYPFSNSELNALPYGDARLGLERAVKMLRPPKSYHRVWPDRIARDSTVMRFPIPSDGANSCAISWQQPPENSTRAKDLTANGDITEIEVWQLIASSATSTSSMDALDYDALSYSNLPVRGELLGVLDLTAQ
ncbi:hypothetical protein SCUP234_02205 [Seiridium cupressi]